jgi:5-hydroxyisourate hydrolase
MSETSGSETAAGRLTTHVLDLRLGQPARNLGYTLSRIVGPERLLLRDGSTNDDGRTPGPLIEGVALKAGIYELVFAVGAYQADHAEAGAAGFYDFIPIRFQVTDELAHYHIPLLLSPFGYSTYRGS